MRCLIFPHMKMNIFLLMLPLLGGNESFLLLLYDDAGLVRCTDPIPTCTFFSMRMRYIT
ncbi:hypothetical protein AAZX31_04G224200 [Glycine max]